MNGRRHAARSRICNLRIIPKYIVSKLVQSRRKQQTKLNKKTVETLLNELFSFDDKENEIKMEE